MTDAGEGMQLWGGEFGPFERKRCYAYFLLAIQKCAPEVLTALRDQVLPDMNQAVAGVRFDKTPFDVDWVAAHRAQERAKEVVSPKIREWAEQFHLYPPPSVKIESRFFDWLWSSAYGTLLEWALNPESNAVLKWTMPTEVSLVECADEPRDFYFHADGWQIFTETKSQAEERILGKLKIQLKTYLERKEKDAKKKGYKQRPRTWETDHFEWLVDRQVQNLSQKKIAESHGMRRQTIDHGIKTAAKLVIGPHWKQWLQPNCKPGRPRRDAH